tara:strand:- start:387 stop:662 length:276 start_codon:yes stop_codon:yes gene_type:complete
MQSPIQKPERVKATKPLPQQLVKLLERLGELEREEAEFDGCRLIPELVADPRQARKREKTPKNEQDSPYMRDRINHLRVSEGCYKGFYTGA